MVTGSGNAPDSVTEVLRAVVEEVVTDLLIVDRLASRYASDSEPFRDEGGAFYRRLRNDVLHAVSRALSDMVMRDIGTHRRRTVAAAARCPLGSACASCSGHRPAPGDPAAGSAGDRS